MANKIIINPKCPKCGNVLTIKLNMVQDLRNEIERLKHRITDLEGVNAFNSVFGRKFKNE